MGEKNKLEIYSARIDNDKLISGENFYCEEKFLGAFREGVDFYAITENDTGSLLAKECVVDPVAVMTANGPKVQTNFYFFDSFNVDNDVKLKETLEQKGIPDICDGVINLDQSTEIKAFAVTQNEFLYMKQLKRQNPERSIADSLIISAMQYEKQGKGNIHF